MSIPFHGNVQVYVNFLIISIIQGFLNNIIFKKVINRKNKIEKREVCISFKKNPKNPNKHLKNTNNREDNNSLKKLQRELFEHIEQEV